MKKAAFYTLGCKVNQYETEAITGLFEKEGYQIVDFEDAADVYVINTCTVTNLSDRKSRQMIRRARKNNENSIVVVVGCYAQTAPDEVSKIPEVNLVIGTKERNKIIHYINQLKSDGDNKINVVDDIMGTKDFESLKIGDYKERTRAFLKIQEGCSQFCTYCIIPYARGPIRSRQPEDVIEEVQRLADAGFVEIVLTGIHVASYGKDLKTTSLLDIVKRVHQIDGIERIRLGSIEPTTITREFIETAAGLKKLCPHYHVSLQSGCDETLQRMNRRYTAGEYKKSIELLREHIDDVSVTTDVMVGFPGETDEEFKATYRFLEDINLAGMHIFKYSPRKGTPAASFKDQVSPEIKDERSHELIKLSEQCTLKFNQKFLGRTMPVLFEQDTKTTEGYLEGHTTNYIKVACAGEPQMKGKILNVILESTSEDSVIGHIIS